MAHRHIVSIVVALLVCVPAPTPSAQTNAGGTARASGGAIDEIIVTARKREESLQDTTISIQAFTEASLSERAVRDLIDIGEQTPNLLFDVNVSQYNPRIYLRGVGNDDLLPTVDPGVGIYLDGVYLPRTSGANLDVVDIERVEVLRGPQGTLYGRNTIGGAINIISKKPAGEFGAVLKAELGTHRTLNTDAAVSFPIVDETLSARLTIGQDYSEGWWDNNFSTERNEWGNNRGANARLALRLTPNETMDWLVSIERVYKNSHPYPVELNTVNEGANPFSAANVAAGLASFIDNDPSDGSVNAGLGNAFVASGNAADPGENSLYSWGLSSVGEFDLDDELTVKSITSYRKLETRLALDIDGTGLGYIDVFFHDENYSFSQELQLNGSWLDDRLQMVSGLYWFYETSKQENDTHNSAGPVYRPIVGAAVSAAQSSDERIDTRVISYAGYANLSYEIVDGLTFDGGIRWTYDDKIFKFARTDKAAIASTNINSHAHFDDWSPMVGVQYRVSDDLQLYAKWSRGYRSGGFNGRAVGASPLTLPTYDPEVVKVTEVGFKSSWLDDKLNLNLAAFRNNFKDQQQTTFTFDGVQFVSLVENTGTTRVLGFEADLYYRPINPLDITASIGVTKAKYLTFRAKSFTSPTAFTEFDVSDRHVKNAPAMTFNVGATYTTEALGGWLSIHANYSYRSKTRFDTGVQATPYNRDSIAQGQFGVLNGRIAWTDAEETLEIALYGKNIANREYDVFGLDFTPSLGFTTTYPGVPVEAGIELTYRFD